MVPMARSHFPCPCSTPPVSRRPTDRSQGSRAKDGSGPRSSSRYKWGRTWDVSPQKKHTGNLPGGQQNSSQMQLWSLSSGLPTWESNEKRHQLITWKIHENPIHFWKNAPIICHNVASPTAWKPPFGDGGVNGCTLMRKTHSNWSVTRAKHFMRKALPVFSKNATLASPKIKHRKVLEGWYRWCWPHHYQMSNCAI